MFIKNVLYMVHFDFMLASFYFYFTVHLSSHQMSL